MSRRRPAARVLRAPGWARYPCLRTATRGQRRMAVSVRQSTWKMVGANTEREILDLSLSYKTTHTLMSPQRGHSRGSSPLKKGRKRVIFLAICSSLTFDFWQCVSQSCETLDGTSCGDAHAGPLILADAHHVKSQNFFFTPAAVE